MQFNLKLYGGGLIKHQNDVANDLVFNNILSFNGLCECNM